MSCDAPRRFQIKCISPIGDASYAYLFAADAGEALKKADSHKAGTAWQVFVMGEVAPEEFHDRSFERKLARADYVVNTYLRANE